MYVAGSSEQRSLGQASHRPPTQAALENKLKTYFRALQNTEQERANILLQTKANKYIVIIPLAYRNSWPLPAQKNPREEEMWFSLPVFTNESLRREDMNESRHVVPDD